MRDMKMRHKTARVENAGGENATQKCRVENAGHESVEQNCRDGNAASGPMESQQVV